MIKILITLVTATTLILAPTKTYTGIYKPEAINGTERAKKPLYTVDRYTEQEIYFMANCVEAEAGNQGETGKRLVASVILNRVESDRYPDTIEGVIKQKGQFASYTDGGMKKWKPKDETIDICKLEISNRSDNGFLSFRTTSFGGRGYKHKDHWFK